MKELFLQLGMPILSAIIEPLLLLIVPPIVSWFAYRWSRLTGKELEQQYRDSLHLALENAVKVGWRRAYNSGLYGKLRDEYAINEAASYVQQFNGGTISRFKLSPDQVKQLAEAHLPKLPAP